MTNQKKASLQQVVPFLLSQDYEEATRLCHEILRQEPDSAETFHCLGFIAIQQARHIDAIDYLQKAIALLDGNAEFFSLLGLAQKADGKLGDAKQSFQQAVRLNPASANDHNNLGVLEMHWGRPDDAATHFAQALQLSPGNLQFMENLGTAFCACGQYEKSKKLLEQIGLHQPDNPVVLKQLGLISCNEHRWNEAVRYYSSLIGLGYSDLDVLIQLGKVLVTLHRYDEAIDVLNRARQQSHDNMEIASSLSVAYHHSKRYDDAMNELNYILSKHPDHALAHFNLACIQLTLGNFADGWPGYEWRWRRTDAKRPNLAVPLWDGHRLDGKRILLLSEQGMGDTIQFSRFAADIRAQGGSPTLACPKSLMPLMALSELFDAVVPKKLESLPEVDAYQSLMSLPGLLHSDEDSLAKHVPYLQADPHLIESWQPLVQATTDLQVGIAWQGNPGYQLDSIRSPGLAPFRAFARQEGVRLISLQQIHGLDQVAPLTGEVPLTLLPGNVDGDHRAFMDTAAIMMSLDLVIASDSATAHLAGALGIPVWLVLPFFADWRWMEDRSRIAWYPSMTIFRQPTLGDWEHLFKRVSNELAKVISDRSLLSDLRRSPPAPNRPTTVHPPIMAPTVAVGNPGGPANSIVLD